LTPLEFWSDLFTSMDVSQVEKVARTVCVYLGIAALIRFGGKRLMAQMNSLDLVVVLLLSNVVQNALIGPDNSLLGGLVGALVLVGFNAGLDRLAQRFQSVRWFLEGTPTTLISDGRVDEAAVTRLGLTDNELLLALRRLGADHPEEVLVASLEPGGSIVVRLKPEEQSATKLDVATAVEQLKAYIDAGRSADGAAR
jgi:uncharacterized membrane protein YcaP (DUF421 family)